MKNIIGRLLLVMIVLLSMVSCTQDKSSDTPASATTTSITTEEVSTTSTTEDIPEIEYLKSDPLPEMWYGKWVCVYSEAYYFTEGEVIFIKDFDNAVLYTQIVGENTYENNRWFCYDEENKIIDIFNEPPPFDKMWIRESFEIKKESEIEIVMTRKGVGQEARFEKADS